MVWQIVNNLDVENAKKIPLSRRTPFIEYKGHFSQEFVDQFEVCSADQFGESNEKLKVAKSQKEILLLSNLSM